MSQNVIYKDIIRNYEKLRDKAQAEMLARQDEIYSNFPEIKKIDGDIASSGLKKMRETMKNPKLAKKLSLSMKEEISALKKERTRILLENGYSEDYLNVKYQCERCKDTGYIGDKKCGCFSQMLVKAVYGRSGLGEALEGFSIKDFDLSLYSDEIYPGAEISPRKHMREVFAAVQNFIAGFGYEFKNLLFYGGTGLGKTFLCSAVAKELLDEGRFVIYVTASQLFKTIEQDKFSKNDDEEPSRFLEDILSAELLIIDDLGSEFSTALSASEAFDIINSRLIQKKPVIISTNLELSDWANIYSDRIISRIWGNYEILEFFGEDIRLKKKFLY